MDRTQKQTFVSELHQRVQSSNAMVVAHYRGLTVKQLTALRRQMAAAGGEVQVAKNRLAKLALKGTRFESVADLLVGPTVLTFAADVVAPAKVTQKFADAHDAMAILGGAMDGKLMTKAEVKALSSLPSLDELRGKLVGLLQAPAAQLARVTKAYADKDGAIAATPVTAEAAPAAMPEAAPVETPAEAAPAETPAA
jgi:large subunit ribosomal protein L10